ARSDRPWGTHGGGDGRGVPGAVCGQWIGDERSEAPLARSQYPVCGERWRAGGAAQGQERSRHGRGVYCEEPYHAGDLWPLGDQGLEEVSLLSDSATRDARSAACGCAHCDAGREIGYGCGYWWSTTSRRLPACSAPHW